MHIRQKTNDKRKTNAAPRRKLRRAVLFPALVLALTLTGCAMGGGEESDSPYVYETQFHSPEGGVELGLIDIGGVDFLPASHGAAGQCQCQN